MTDPVMELEKAIRRLRNHATNLRGSFSVNPGEFEPEAAAIEAVCQAAELAVLLERIGPAEEELELRGPNARGSWMAVLYEAGGPVCSSGLGQTPTEALTAATSKKDGE